MTSWIGWIMTAALLGPAPSPGDAGAASGVPLPACTADVPAPVPTGDAVADRGVRAGTPDRPDGARAPVAPPETTWDDDPGSPYYAFDLVATGRVPGTGRATGTARAAFASSPFGVTVAPDGSYVYDLLLDVEGLGEPPEGAYHVWVTTPSLDRVEHQGTLVPGTPFRGGARWNKFLVVVTLEPGDAVAAAGSGAGATAGGASPEGSRGTDFRALDTGSAGPDMWSGPVVLRGMSRSGMMHTMAGHGPFEQENCAAYGYEE